MKCLRDNTNLVPLTLRGTATYYCDNCKGVLLPRSSLDEIYDGLEFDRKPGGVADFGNRTFVSNSDLLCPVCITACFDHHKLEDLQLDVCPKCKAIWFDVTELDRLGAKLEPKEPPPAEPGASLSPASQLIEVLVWCALSLEFHIRKYYRRNFSDV